jgi:hypothetical protein
MDSEFSVARVKKQLNGFASHIDEIMFNDDISPDELAFKVKGLIKLITDERDRAENNLSSVIEESNYLPALNEAISFLGLGLTENSNTDLNGYLYDAAFSLRYYLHH